MSSESFITKPFVTIIDVRVQPKHNSFKIYLCSSNLLLYFTVLYIVHTRMQTCELLEFRGERALARAAAIAQSGPERGDARCVDNEVCERAEARVLHREQIKHP